MGQVVFWGAATGRGRFTSASSATALMAGRHDGVHGVVDADPVRRFLPLGSGYDRLARPAGVSLRSRR